MPSPVTRDGKPVIEIAASENQSNLGPAGISGSGT